MDFTITNKTKTPDTQTESPPPPPLTKSLSFTNNTFQLQLCHHNNQNQPPQQMVVSYKECLKNHAAKMGGHALDGCGEFMPSPTATQLDPTSLKCAACGCHRNFHRRDPYHLPPPPPPPPHTPSRSPSSGPSSGPSSPSPAPYSYYTSAPHMLLALSSGYPQPFDDTNNPIMVKRDNNNNNNSNNPSVRKRSRTKFSVEQKEKMSSFAEKLGWRLQRSDDKLVQQFCNEVGIERGVFKVWMHNNKQTLGKRGNIGFCHDNNNNNNNNGVVGNVNGSYKSNINGNNEGGGGGDHVSVNVTTNGSYSSSLVEEKEGC